MIANEIYLSISSKVSKDTEETCPVTYVRIYIYIYIYTYVHIYVYTKYIYIYKYISVYIYNIIYMCIWTYV